MSNSGLVIGSQEDPGSKRLVKIGARYNATELAVADADDVPVNVDPSGKVRTEEYLIRQARAGTGKDTINNITKTTTADETIATWTVTSGKTGYLHSATISYKSHASETFHEIIVTVNSVQKHYMAVGQGHRVEQFMFPIPFKAAAGQIIKISAKQATVNSTDYMATLNGWEE